MMVRVPARPQLPDGRWTAFPSPVKFCNARAQHASGHWQEVTTIDPVWKVFGGVIVRVFNSTRNCRQSSANLRISHDPSSLKLELRSGYGRCRKHRSWPL
ncbi:hypothetical protein SAMN05216328_13538 [Ensifer sp. YR511]|nr:hypothetical protein SAMN05216328_13538 [Ensifer sp. YR511]